MTILVALLHIGHIAQQDGGATLAPHDNRTNLAHRGQRIARAHQIPDIALVDGPSDEIDVFLLQTVDDLWQRQPQTRQTRLIYLHSNFFFKPAADLHRGHPVDHFKAAFDRVFRHVAQG